MASTIELLRQGRKDEVWQRYCGFLDLSLEEFTAIQRRLLTEQIGLLGRCEMGRAIMGGTAPKSVEEFREVAPTTTYKDYAPYLDERREDVLPAKPLMWSHTGGTTGRWKQAPLTRTMYDLYADYCFAVALLGSSKGRGDFSAGNNDIALYAGAPPPYLSGIGFEAIQQVVKRRYVPPLDKVRELDFRERMQLGFTLALRTGLDMTGGLASVMARMGAGFGERERSLKPLLHPAAAWRVIRAAIRAKRAGRPMMPRDLWQLKAVLCTGMDVDAFRDKVKRYWNVDPFELYTLTEAGGILAMQTWNRKGMTFTPDTAFLEFIPEQDALRSRDDPSYKAPTVLIDELGAGMRYEVVLTNFHGGAFVRYRPGDLIKIIALEEKETGVRLPQMVFEARVDCVIDIGGFSRLNERIIWQTLESIGVQYEDWMARKELEGGLPVLRIYLAAEHPHPEQLAASLHETLKALDGNYADLESMLGISPLRLRLLPVGTFARYAQMREARGVDLAHAKPPHMQASEEIKDEVLRMAQS